MKTVIYILTFLILLNVTFASGGFGEVAGPLVYNAFVSGPQTRTWTLVNNYNYSLGFYVTKPNISNVSITASVTNGTIKRNSYFSINVTIVSHTNRTESGYITAYSVSNNTNSSGATLRLGITKLIEINGTGTVNGQTPSQTGISGQTTKSTTSSIQTTASSTSIQTTQIIVTQNKNSSIQSAGGGSAALSISVVIPYLIVAIVLLLVVVCALLYHITRKKPVTKKRRKKKPLRRRR